jgi:hypothetical protein
MLDDAVMGDAKGEFLQENGAMITHQSSADAIAEGIVTHRLHLLSRRMYRKNMLV